MSEENLQTEEAVDQQNHIDEAVDQDDGHVEQDAGKELSAEENQAKILEEVLGGGDKEENIEQEDVAAEKDQAEEEKAEQEEPKTEKEIKEDKRSDDEIAQSLKSERGKQRFQEIIKEKAELEQANKGYEEIVSGLQETLQSARLTPEDFALNIEFSRLRNSDNPSDMRIAFEMLEQERANLAMKLGIVAPGIDYLKDHPDIAKAYQDGKIDDNYALELIRNRHYANEMAQNKQQQEQSYARQAQNQKAIDQSIGQINAYLSSKKGEIDFPAKEKYIAGILSDPAKVNELANTYEPHQWPHVVKMLYETASVQQAASAAQKRSSQPISSRTSTLGKPSVSGQTEEDRMLSILDNMGL